MSAGQGPGPRVAVLAPTPILTVTLERDGSEPELHLHPGGQGFWVARMIHELGVAVSFCAPLGGEVGAVLGPLLERQGLGLHVVAAAGCNGSYIHERSGDALVEIGTIASPHLTRHEGDELYATMLAASLDAHMAVLTGPREDGMHVLERGFLGRLAADLRRNGSTVLADLSGSALTSALKGGIDVLHISAEELRTFDPLIGADAGRDDFAAAMRRIQKQGAERIILSMGPDPALVLIDGDVFELAGPVFAEREHRGAGDSMFAAVAATLAKDRPFEEALRVGAAAGALNVVRRGLGTGRGADLAALADSVDLRRLDLDRAD